MRETSQTPVAPHHRPESEPDEGHEGATEEEVQPLTPPWADLPDDNPIEPPNPVPLEAPEGDPTTGELKRQDPKPRPERSEAPRS